MKDQTYTPRHDDKTGWKSRHLTAVAEPLGSIYGPEKPTHERAMVLMFAVGLNMPKRKNQRSIQILGMITY